jgi:hypothetical protein
LILGDAKTFLQHYDLISSSVVVRDQLSNTLGNSLGVLDSLSFTPGLVTFITWSLIGLVTFSTVQALVRASGVIEYERELGSNRYVHPQNFSQKSYWRHIVADALASFGLSVSLVVVATLYVVFVVPTGLTYTQQFIVHASLAHLLNLLLGMLTILIGTGLLYLLLKVVVWHHRYTQR